MAEDSRVMLDALLGEFGRSVGMPELKTNDEGVSILLFDNRIEIDIMVDPHTAMVVLWRTLGQLPQSDTMGAQRRLLEANAFWKRTQGATLSLMPESNDVIAAMQWPLSAIDLETFRTLIETLLESSEELSGLLAPQTASVSSSIPIGLRA